MPDITYKFTGKGQAPYGDPFVVKDSWAQWLQDVWATALTGNGYSVQLPPWVPTYEEGIVSWPGNDGTMQSTALNPLEFPTQETCQILANRYAVSNKSLVIVSVPFLGGGPIMSHAIQRLLMWPNGATLPAFQLANYFTNNPEDKSTAADTLCKLLILQVYP